MPNGPSYFRPPLFTGRSFSVWQPQPPAAPKMYLPWATRSAPACAWAHAEGDRQPGQQHRASRTRQFASVAHHRPHRREVAIT